jgi:hypothetical protein
MWLETTAYITTFNQRRGFAEAGECELLECECECDSGARASGLPSTSCQVNGKISTRIKFSKKSLADKACVDAPAQ